MKTVFYGYIFLLLGCNSPCQSVGYEKVLKGHDRIITCFDIDQNSKYLISGSFGGDIIVWDYEDGRNNFV